MTRQLQYETAAAYSYQNHSFSLGWFSHYVLHRKNSARCTSGLIIAHHCW